MTDCSEEFLLVMNLRNTALDHKKHCKHNCDVSLNLLKQAAINLNRWTRTWEREEANKLIEEMPNL